MKKFKGSKTAKKTKTSRASKKDFPKSRQSKSFILRLPQAELSPDHQSQKG